MASNTRGLCVAILAVLGLALGGCQGAGLTGPTGTTAVGTPGEPQPMGTPRPGSSRVPRGARTGTVAVSARDLAPVDAYFRAGAGGANTRWILGDTVDIVASKEYFAGILSVNRGPFVTRHDTKVGDDTVVTLKFLGSGNQASASNNPRVQLGTGLTVTAYSTLRVRLVKTVDRRVPVRLHITARGRAARGHREHVIKRGELLTMGGSLVASGGQWVWSPIEG